jgi:hypothetical protein
MQVSKSRAVRFAKQIGSAGENAKKIIKLCELGGLIWQECRHPGDFGKAIDIGNVCICWVRSQSHFLSRQMINKVRLEHKILLKSRIIRDRQGESNGWRTRPRNAHRG